MQDLDDTGERSDARPQSELAYEIIVTRIVRLDITPGTALVERALIEELGFGRTPIREALQRLTFEGLVCREHYRGVYVCNITPESIREIAEIRKAADPAIARLAAERATPLQLERLDECLGRMRGQLAGSRNGGFYLTSRSFHCLLAEATQNMHFVETARRLQNFDARMLYLVGRLSDDHMCFAAERLASAEALLAAVRRGNGEEADAAMRLYLATYFEKLNAVADSLFRSGSFWAKVVGRAAE